MCCRCRQLELEVGCCWCGTEGVDLPISRRRRRVDAAWGTVVDAKQDRTSSQTSYFSASPTYAHSRSDWLIRAIWSAKKQSLIRSIELVGYSSCSQFSWRRWHRASSRYTVRLHYETALYTRRICFNSDHGWWRDGHNEKKFAILFQLSAVIS